MTNTTEQPDGLCMPYDVACRMHQEATDAIKFLTEQSKILAASGYPTAELDAKIVKTKRKLAVLKRKWSL